MIIGGMSVINEVLGTGGLTSPVSTSFLSLIQKPELNGITQIHSKTRGQVVSCLSRVLINLFLKIKNTHTKNPIGF